MSTRLDEIERDIPADAPDDWSVVFTAGDVLALVAVARAAELYRNFTAAYVSNDVYAIALDAALAPLLAEREG